MISSRALDAQLLRRYDRAGPRYTSYPTAPQFSTQFGVPQFEQYARCAGQDGHRPLALYIHVPFCSSPCLYCGCNRVITRSPERGTEYVARLLREAERVAPLFAGREVVQVHLGGGTPNFLSPDELAEIVEGLQAHFTFAPSHAREMSVELDPRFSRPDDFALLAHAGFKRVSFGVQDFSYDVQVAVNRIQSVDKTLEALAASRAAGIHSINIDLMYGLPRQTVAGFEKTLQTVIQARPTRVAIYGYAHLPQLFKAQQRIRSSELPDALTRITLLQLAIEQLGKAGYRHIGMDHFAVPEDELVGAQQAGRLQRNFMGYTTHSGTDLLGLGVSAISHLGASFSQNFRELPQWEAAVDRGEIPVWRGMQLGHDDLLRADVISQLMCQGEVDITATEARHAVDFWQYFQQARADLENLQRDGLVWICSSRITATDCGHYLLRVLAACFDRYLPEQASGTYSKVV